MHFFFSLKRDTFKGVKGIETVFTEQFATIWHDVLTPYFNNLHEHGAHTPQRKWRKMKEDTFFFRMTSCFIRAYLKTNV